MLDLSTTQVRNLSCMDYLVQKLIIYGSRSSWSRPGYVTVLFYMNLVCLGPAGTSTVQYSHDDVLYIWSSTCLLLRLDLRPII